MEHIHSRKPHEADAARTPERPRIALRVDADGARPPLRSRRALQPLPLIGFALMLVALLLVLGVYASASKRSSVLVAARNLPAGTLLSSSDLRGGRIAA